MAVSFEKVFYVMSLEFIALLGIPVAQPISAEAVNRDAQLVKESLLFVSQRLGTTNFDRVFPAWLDMVYGGALSFTMPFPRQDIEAAVQLFREEHSIGFRAACEDLGLGIDAPQFLPRSVQAEA
jgi:predicted acyltransferase